MNEFPCDKTSTCTNCKRLGQTPTALEGETSEGSEIINALQENFPRKHFREYFNIEGLYTQVINTKDISFSYE